MQISVKPQDKRPLVKAEFELHPDILIRLQEYAKSLDDSDPSYVLGEVLNQALPALGKALKPTPAKTTPQVPKRQKEPAKEAA